MSCPTREPASWGEAPGPGWLWSWVGRQPASLAPRDPWRCRTGEEAGWACPGAAWTSQGLRLALIALSKKSLKIFCRKGRPGRSGPGALPGQLVGGTLVWGGRGTSASFPNTGAAGLRSGFPGTPDSGSGDETSPLRALSPPPCWAAQSEWDAGLEQPGLGLREEEKMTRAGGGRAADTAMMPHTRVHPPRPHRRQGQRKPRAGRAAPAQPCSDMAPGAPTGCLWAGRPA